MLNPPPEKLAATSGIPVVPPTVVTLHVHAVVVRKKRSEAEQHDAQGAAGWERRQKFDSIRAVVREALLSLRVRVAVADTEVTRRKDD